MSLGAVVVLIYGINKLTPFTAKKAQTSQNQVSTKAKEVSIEKLLEPKITEHIKVNVDNEVQFLDINKLYTINFEVDNTDKPQIASNNNTTPNINENIGVENDDSIKEIIKPNVAFYIYEKPKANLQLIAFYQFQPLLASEEENQTPEPTPTLKPAEVYTTTANTNHDTQVSSDSGAPQDIIALIEKYAVEYGVDRNMMIGIAKCESGFRENAINGPYAGIYQFVSGTWISNRRAMGLDENLDLRFNAEEAVRTAAFKMNRDGFGAWPVCQHKARRLLVTNTQNL